MAEPHEYTLIAAPHSYFSGKLRAYLRFKCIPFKELLASAEVMESVVKAKTGVRYIPVVITPSGVALQDTTVIIDYFESFVEPKHSIYPSTPKQCIAAMLLELYGDEWLTIPAMHYRWSYADNLPFLCQEFGKTVAPNLSEAEQVQLGQRAMAYFRNLPSLLGISDEMIAPIEHWTYELLDQLECHFATYEYLFGSKPSIGDFGLFGPLYAHLYRDPHSGSILRHRAPNVCRWIERMNKPKPLCGEFLADDCIPSGIHCLFQRIFKELFPYLVETDKKLAVWLLNRQAGIDDLAPIPRSIGTVAFTLNSVKGQRAAITYSLWMLRRILEKFHCVTSSADTGSEMRCWLRAIGGSKENGCTWLDWKPLCHVERLNNRTVARLEHWSISDLLKPMAKI